MNTSDFFNRVYINKGEVIVTDTEEKAIALQEYVKGRKVDVLDSFENAFVYALELLEEASNYKYGFDNFEVVECYPNPANKFDVIFVFPIK